MLSIKPVFRKLAFLSILSLMWSNSFAQNQHAIDSLKIILTQNPNDTIVLLVNLNLGRNFHNFNSNIALDYYGTAEKVGQEILSSNPSKKKSKSVFLNLAPAYYNIGLLNLYSKKKYEESRLYFQKALKLFKKNGDHLKVAQTHALIGDTYSKQNQVELALESYKNVDFKLHDGQNNTIGIAYTLNSIGWFYLNQKHYYEANTYFSNALVIAGEFKHSQLIALINQNLGELNFVQNKYSDALDYYKIALKLFSNFNDKLSMARCCNSIANSYESQDIYNKALSYYDQSNSLFELLDENIYIGFNLNSMGFIYYYDIDDNTKALSAFNEAYKIFISDNLFASAALASEMLGTIYKNNEDFMNTLKYYNIAFELYTKIEDKKSAVDALFDIAMINNLQANYSLALKQYLQCIDLYKELNNTEKLHEVYTYCGEIYFNKGDFDNALIFYNNGLVICNETNNLDYYYTLLNNIGLVYSTKGDFDKALDYYGESLDYNIKTNNSEGLLMNYMNIGKIEMERGNLIRSLEYFQDALQIAKKTNSYFLPRIYNNIGMVYTYLGNYDKAKRNLNRAIVQNNTSLIVDKQLQTIILLNIGNIYLSKSNNPEALEYYLKSLELAVEINYFGIVQNYINIGTIYQSQGDQKKALYYYSQALKKSKDTDNKVGEIYSLNSIGRMNVVKMQYDTSIIVFNEALKISQEVGDKINEAEALTWIASIQHINAELESSLQNYLKAYDIFLKIESPFGIASIYDRLGRIYYDLEQFELSKEYTLKSLKLAESVENYEKIKSASWLMKWLAIKEGDFKNADYYANKIISINNQSIISNFDIMSEKSQELFIKTIEKEYMDYNSYALARVEDNPKVSNIVYNNTLKNKGLLLKSSIAMRKTILDSEDTTLSYQYKKWISIKQQIAHLLTLPKDERGQNIDDLEKQSNNLETELIKLSSKISEFNNLQNITWQDVQRSLRANEASIEFINFNYADYSKSIVDFSDTTVYCALIITPDSKHPKMIPLFPEKELVDYIESIDNSNNANLISQLYGKKRGAELLKSSIDYVEYSDSLSSIIWDKIEPNMENIETIYYSPSGILHNISFSALHYNDTLLLSDKYKLVYLSSTGKLTVNKIAKDISTFNVAIYGGLNYDVDTASMQTLSNKYNSNNDEVLAQRSITLNDSVRGGIWNYLEGTLQETENLYGMFVENGNNTQLYTANNGIEESFKSLAGRNSPEIIHLATHGYFFPDPEFKLNQSKNNIPIEIQQLFKTADNPLIRSGLIMSGANSAWVGNYTPVGIDDGILTAYEVSRLDLFNTELVVLSACETGLGDIKGSEGVYGLQRSFKMAGVDNLVMSLWQVPDKETAEFMQLFYKNLLENNSIGNAFRLAQNVMKKKYDPYYWAAFILIE